jgi:3-oxoacyl-[acyl-carrier protein] reductase
MSRTALVIGGNCGIGLATARALSTDGFRVAVTYRDSPRSGDVVAVRCDVGDIDEAAALTEQRRAHMLA